MKIVASILALSLASGAFGGSRERISDGVVARGRDNGGKKGGKKGMSMSMSMGGGGDDGSNSAEYCNSGSDRCEAQNQCAEFTSNRLVNPSIPVVNTDACEMFCDTNMIASNYFIQFSPNFEGSGENLCQCFEECAVWEDISGNAADFVNLFAVGTKECDDIESGEVGFSEDTDSTLCQPFSCTSKQKDPIPFDDVDNQQDCANLCASVDRPIFALNLGSSRCFCLEDCSATGTVGGMTSVYAIDGEAMCTDVPAPLPVACSGSNEFCNDKCGALPNSDADDEEACSDACVAADKPFFDFTSDLTTNNCVCYDACGLPPTPTPNARSFSTNQLMSCSDIEIAGCPN